MPDNQSLEVWGDLACFTRPDLKVERFSYPVITPSAARAIFEAIYFRKSKFRWQVTRVELLSFPHYTTLRRNEVKEVASERKIIQWMLGKEEPEPIWAGAGAEANTQRQTMALKQVHYRLYAQIRPWPQYRADLLSFEAQFRRRAVAGQCVYQPYFGCREFPAYFQPCSNGAQPKPVPLDMHVGWMLYDVFDLSKVGDKTDAPFISLFDATITKGVMVIPEFLSAEVRKPVKGASHA